MLNKVAGHLKSLASNLLGGGSSVGTPNTAAMGATLSSRSNFEINTDQFAHTKVNKYGFGSLVYPKQLETDPGYGHYIMFYIYRTYNSKYSPASTKTVTENVGGPSGGYTRQKTETTGGAEGISSSPQAGFNPKLYNKDPGAKSKSIRSQLGFVKTSDAISLYMPNNIKASYNAGYRDSETGAAGQFAKMSGIGPGSSISDIMSRLGSGGGQFLKEVVGEKLLKDIPAAIGEFMGGGDIEGVVRLTSQKAVNPHLEAIFEKVSFRNFNYSFRFTPQSEEEVETVDKIIKLFKFHMLPERPQDNAVGRYLVFPSEFEIHYMYKGVENTWLPFISSCVLTGVDISYGPNGQFQTFRPLSTAAGDSAPPPTVIEMTLSFKETEIMTKEKIMQGF